MTGSTDRKNKFYDLLGKPFPQLISKNLFKSQITCGDWFTNWTTYFVGLDESLAFRKYFCSLFVLLLNFKIIFRKWRYYVSSTVTIW